MTQSKGACEIQAGYWGKRESTTAVLISVELRWWDGVKWWCFQLLWPWCHAQMPHDGYGFTFLDVSVSDFIRIFLIFCDASIYVVLLDASPQWKLTLLSCQLNFKFGAHFKQWWLQVLVTKRFQDVYGLNATKKPDLSKISFRVKCFHLDLIIVCERVEML